MNSFELGCALFSASVYQKDVSTHNRIEDLAVELMHINNPGSGFEASAYEFEGKVIIAYAGTKSSQISDILADAALALGLEHPQLQEAATFYEAIKNDPRYAGKEIVFTGHSLGGGLAALMGVFFDKQAITFDPAPFRLAATQANAHALASMLAASHPEWPVDSDLAGYHTREGLFGLSVPGLASVVSTLVAPVNPALAAAVFTRSFPVTVRGEEKVQAYSLGGEVLTTGYAGMLADDLNTLRIQSGARPQDIPVHPAVAGMEFDLHSINLLKIGRAHV